ncbi:hypothetical protein [Streptomyces sp. CNQ085]|uniref:hypothetical protein n=1 Tax=Streptomyces sp. CNQ085 TaxID=2886944 RepID=UPI001F506FCB|nr:hypothetical protein [Streptomyces sp. CNQ085]MCI0384798.1 hypothetical protein [Streptomyces sp. CNQ085]
MSGQVHLRDVESADLEEFLTQEHDPEAVRRVNFPPREREKACHLYADPLAGNTGSVRLPEKYGFRRTETVRYAGHEPLTNLWPVPRTPVSRDICGVLRCGPSTARRSLWRT